MKHLEETPWFICDKEDENYCAYVDTDSNYFNAEPILKHLYPNFELFSDEEKDEKLLQQFNLTFKNYLKNMESFQIDKALKNIFDYLSEVNAYVDEQAPWSLKKTDTTRMQDVLYVITLITIKCSVLLQPIIPSSIAKVLNIYNLSLKELDLININDFNPNTIKLNTPKPIFPRIEK